MKLILLTALVLKYTGDVRAHEQYGFPQFQKQHSGVFASDSSVYLPPESHTPLPYYPMKNINNLPFPYLPPTGTKAPSMYPSPFPVILSSTLVPIFDDDDEKEEREERNKIRISSPPPPKPQIKHNATENVPNSQQAMRREMRLPAKMPNYHNPIDRIDMRLPARDFPLGQTTANPINQSPRNMIISVDTHRNDRGFDQIRAPSMQNLQYIPSPGFSISSTTEPAIPILRLSNEMDLDGSFSYEALGADQTHYVQHSHMENQGTEKEEQVVEGSYSYVGDNGQTYTVHYIADSNGFRASGDHLPVAPPIPEIIQRAVQYNLAEEAKKPPHLKSWQGDGGEYESIDKQQYYNLPAQPPRSLFTGRAPEAFSYNFGQGSNNFGLGPNIFSQGSNNIGQGQASNNENSLSAAASSQVPVKTNNEFTADQTRGKSNGPISPQVTFLASQGAHVPSTNNSPQQSISRMFTTERSTMPQLMNYDAGIKEAERGDNKGLWRWQYGLNANNANQTPEKNTISRSSGEGDDIMINFSDMTPDQYTKMLQSQIDPSTKGNSVPTSFASSQQNNQNSHYIPKSDGLKEVNEYQNHNFNNYYKTNNDTHQLLSSTQSTEPAYIKESQKNNFNKYYKADEQSHQPTSAIQGTTTLPYSFSTNYPDNPLSMESSSLTYKPSNNIKPKNDDSPLKAETENYDYPDNTYEPRRIKALHIDSTIKPNVNHINSIPFSNQEPKVSYNNIWSNAKDLQLHLQNEPKTVTETPAFFNNAGINVPKYTDFSEYKSEFKPILQLKDQEERQTTTTTTTSTSTTTTSSPPESSTEDLFRTNIFLKGFGTPKKPAQNHLNNPVEEPKKVVNNKVAAETKADKVPKYIPYQPKPYNEINSKSLKKKPMELSDVINYINMKNYFESSKVKPKNFGYHNYDNVNEMRYNPIQYDQNEDVDEGFSLPQPKNKLPSSNSQDKEYNSSQPKNSLRSINNHEHEELRGIIKNYKVLQRNNHARHSDSNSYQNLRELTPPPVKMHQSAGLPPLGRAGPSMKTYLPPTYI